MLRRLSFGIVVRRASTTIARPPEIDAIVTQLQNCVEKKSYKNFSLSLKDFAAKHPNLKNKSILYPFLTTSLFTGVHSSCIAEIIWSLGKLGFEVDSPILKQSDAIHVLLNRYLAEPVSNTKSFTELWTGLQNLKYIWRKSDETIKKGLLARLESQCGVLGARQLSNVMFSVSGCEITWGHLTEKIRRAMINRCIDNIDKIDDLSGQLMLGSLSRFRFKLYTESVEVQDDMQYFITKLLQLTKKSTAPNKTIGVIHVLTSLYSIGTEFPNFSEYQKTLILSLLDEPLYRISCEEVSSLLQWLGRFKVKWSDLSSSAKGRFEVAVVDYLPVCNEDQLTMMLFGLAQMEVKLSNFSTKLTVDFDNGTKSTMLHFQYNVLDALYRVFSDESRGSTRIQTSSSSGRLESIPKIVYSLGQFGLSYVEIPEQIQVIFWQSITRCAQLNDIDMSQMLKGLSGMQVEWKHLYPEVRQFINSHMKSPAPLKNEGQNLKHSINIIISLGDLKAPWNELSHTRLENTIFKLKDQIDSAILYNLLLSLRKMDASSSTMALLLINPLIQKISESVKQWSAEQLSQVMYSLVLLTFDYVHQFEDFNSLKPREKYTSQLLLASHTALLQSFKERNGTTVCNEEQLSQVAVYGAFLQTTYQHKPQVIELLDALSLQKSRPTSSSTEAEKIMELQQLLNKKFDLVEKISFLPFDVLPIDLQLFPTGQKDCKVLVDVINPEEYSHCRLRLLKKFLYGYYMHLTPLLSIKSCDVVKVAKYL